MKQTETQQLLPDGWTLKGEWAPGMARFHWWAVPEQGGWPSTEKYFSKADVVEAARRLDSHYRETPPAPQGALFE